MIFAVSASKHCRSVIFQALFGARQLVSRRDDPALRSLSWDPSDRPFNIYLHSSNTFFTLHIACGMWTREKHYWPPRNWHPPRPLTSFLLWAITTAESLSFGCTRCRSIIREHWWDRTKAQDTDLATQRVIIQCKCA